MGDKVKSIKFSLPKELELLEYCNNMENFSKHIKNMVRAEMQVKKSQDSFFQELITEKIQKNACKTD